jgi:hypothetical protein
MAPHPPRRGRHRLRPSACGVVLAAALGVVAFGAPGARARAVRPAAEQVPLVSMRQVNGQIFQTVSVAPDGSGRVGVFIGEVTSIRYHAFTLDARSMTRLRRLVSATRSLRRQVFLSASASANPFVVDTEYILAIGTRSLVTDSSHAPRRLEALVVDLTGLIDHYSHAVSDHRPGG